MQILVEEAQVYDWVGHKLAWTMVCNFSPCPNFSSALSVYIMNLMLTCQSWSHATEQNNILGVRHSMGCTSLCTVDREWRVSVVKAQVLQGAPRAKCVYWMVLHKKQISCGVGGVC